MPESLEYNLASCNSQSSSPTIPSPALPAPFTLPQLQWPFLVGLPQMYQAWFCSGPLHQPLLPLGMLLPDTGKTNPLTSLQSWLKHQCLVVPTLITCLWLQSAPTRLSVPFTLLYYLLHVPLPGASTQAEIQAAQEEGSLFASMTKVQSPAQGRM